MIKKAQEYTHEFANTIFTISNVIEKAQLDLIDHIIDHLNNMPYDNRVFVDNGFDDTIYEQLDKNRVINELILIKSKLS